MRYILYILSFSVMLTGELEVDGNLKVQGTIDAQNNTVTNVGAPLTMSDAVNAGILQSALSNDGPFEFKFIHVLFYNGDEHSSPLLVQYKLEDTGGSWISNFDSYWGEVSAEGWLINDRIDLNHSDNYGVYYVYELKRKIQE